MTGAYEIPLVTDAATGQVSKLITQVQRVPPEIAKVDAAAAKAFDRPWFKQQTESLAKLGKQMDGLNKVVSEFDKLSSAAGTGFSAKLKKLREDYVSFGKKLDVQSYQYLKLASAAEKYDDVVAYSITLLKRARVEQEAYYQAEEKLHSARVKAQADLAALNSAEGRRDAQQAASAKVQTDLINQSDALHAKLAILSNEEGKLALRINASSEARLKQIQETAALTAQLDALKSGQAKENLVLAEKVKRLSQSATYYERLKTTMSELQSRLADSNRSLLDSIARRKEESKELERAATFYTRLANQSAELARQTDSNNRWLIEGVARRKEEVKELERAATFYTRLANQSAELARQTDSNNRGLIEGIARRKEEVKELERAATFYTRLANQSAELSRQTDFSNRSLVESVARRKEEVKEIERAATFYTRLANQSTELARQADLSNRGLIESVARRKEESKELERAATFYTRLANQSAELARQADLTNRSLVEGIAKRKEEVKEIERASTFYTRLANQSAELARQTDSNNRGLIEGVARRKEEVKELERAATFYTKLVNQETALKQAMEPLNAAVRERVVRLQEQQRGIDQVIAYQQKLVSQENLLRAQQQAINSGATQTISTLQADVDMKKKAEAATAALSFATGMLTKGIYQQWLEDKESLKQTELKASAMAKLQTRTVELQTSINTLSTTEGKENVFLTEKEALLRRMEVLRARQNTEIKSLIAEMRQLEGEEQRALKTTLELTGAAHAQYQAFAALRGMMTGLGMYFGSFATSTMLISVAMYAVGTAMREALSSGADFEDQLYRVAAVTEEADFATKQYQGTLSALSEKADSVVLGSWFSHSDTARAMKEMAMTGMSVEEIMISVKDVMNMAAIGELQFAEASDIATNIMLGFGLQAEDLANVVDVMTIATVKSNATVQNLGLTMSYVAPVAKSFGVSLEFVSAATMVLADAGIKGSRAGTSLRRIISSIFTPTQKGAQAMKDFGLSTDSVVTGMEGLEGIESPLNNMLKKGTDGTQALIKKFKEFYVVTNGAKENLGLLKDVVEIRAIPAFTLLLQSMEEGERGLLSFADQLKYVSGAQDEMMYKMTQSTQKSWLIFKNSVEATGVELFKLFSKDLGAVIDELTSRMHVFAGNKDALQALVDMAKELGSAFVSLIKIMVAWKALKFSIAVAESVAALAKMIVELKLATFWTTAFGTSIKNVWKALVLPAVIITGLGMLLSKLEVVRDFIDDIAGIEWVRKLINSIKSVGEDLGVIGGSLFNWEGGEHQVELAKEFNDLVDGGMQTLLAQRDAVDGIIESLTKQDTLTSSQSEMLGEQLKLREELSAQVAKAYSVMDEMASVSHTKRIAELDTEISKYEEALKSNKERAESDKTWSLPYAMYEGAMASIDVLDWYTDPLEAAENVKTLSDRIAELKNELAGLKAASALSGKTTNEQLKAMQVEARTAEQSIFSLRKAKEELLRDNEELLAGGLSGDEIGKWDKNIELIQKLDEQMQAYRRTIDAVKLAVDLNSRSHVDMAKEEKDVLTNLNAQYKLRYESLGESEAVAEALQLNKDVTRNYSEQAEFLSRYNEIQKLFAERSSASADAQAGFSARIRAAEASMAEFLNTTSLSGEDLKKFTSNLSTAMDKWNPVVKTTNELREAMLQIVAVSKYTGQGMDQVGANVRQAASELLEMDEVTGKLTQTSRSGLEALRGYLATQSDIAKTALANLKKLPASTAALAPKLEQAQRESDSLATALSTVNGVLGGTISLQAKAKDESKSLEDAQSALVTVLGLVGLKTAALAVERRKEMAQADKATKSILTLKNALEDLVDAQEMAHGLADGLQGLREIYASLSEDQRELVGELDFGFIDTSPADNAVTSLMRQVGSSINRVRDLGTEVTKAFDSGFDKLETRLERLVAQVIQGLRDVDRESRGLSETPASTLYSGAPQFGAGSSAQVAQQVATPDAFKSGSQSEVSGYWKYIESAKQATEATEELKAAQSDYYSQVVNNLRVGPKQTEMTRAQKTAFEQYLPAITAVSEELGVSRDKIVAIMAQESNFNSKAVSPAGALGLMQLMPKTAAEVVNSLGGRGSNWATDPSDNILVGTAYYKSLEDRFGSEEKAIRAYNAGPTAVSNGRGYSTETVNYVKQVTGNLSELSGGASGSVKQFSMLSNEIKTATGESQKLVDYSWEIKDATDQTKVSTSNLINEQARYLTTDQKVAWLKDKQVFQVKKLAAMERELVDLGVKANGTSGNEQIVLLDQLQAKEAATNTLREQLTRTTEDLSYALADQQRERERAIRTGNLENVQLETSKEKLRAYASEFGTAKAKLAEYNDALYKLKSLLASGEATPEEYFDAELDLRIKASTNSIKTYFLELEKSANDWEGVFTDVTDSLKDEVSNFFATGKFDMDSFLTAARDRLADFASDAVFTAIRTAFEKAFLSDTTSGFGSLLSKFLGIGVGAATGTIGGNGLVNSVSSSVGPFGVQYFNAHGNVVASDLTHGVYTSPTIFPMSTPGHHRYATGTGLLGEAGPEAVLPLQRIGADLGVKATTTAPNINIEVKNYGATVTTEQIDENTIRIIARAEVAQYSNKHTNNMVAASVRNPNGVVGKSISNSFTAQRKR